MNDRADANSARRGAILDAAVQVFLRYGFKKTSMDDLSRAAGLSRQGLYLHFSTKEELFKDGLIRLIAENRAAGQVALADEALPIEGRVLQMFVAIHAHMIGQIGAEQMSELMVAAKQIVGPVVEEHEQAQVADLIRVLRTAGAAAAWKDAGISVKDLAEHLFAASYGVKHSVKTLGEYRERMGIAVKMALRGKATR